MQGTKYDDLTCSRIAASGTTIRSLVFLMGLWFFLPLPMVSAADFKQYRDQEGFPAVSVFAYVPGYVAREFNAYCRNQSSIWSEHVAEIKTSIHVYSDRTGYFMAINLGGKEAVYQISRDFAQYTSNFLMLQY